jgi:amino acid transporter
MQRFLIKCVNCALLIIIAIGIPAITHVEFRGLDIGSERIYKLLLFWALGLGLAFNLFVASFVLKKRKERLLCWEWAAVFGVLFFAYAALAFGYFNFNWLKNFLLRLQNYF